MSEEPQAYGPLKTIILQDANGPREVVLKMVQDELVPVGHLLWYEDIYNCFKERVQKDVKPLLILLEEKVAEEQLGNLDYELLLDKFEGKKLTLKEVINRLDEFCSVYFGYDQFRMQLVVNCTREINAKMQFSGTAIDFGYWSEGWLHEESDTDFKIWLFSINKAETTLDRAFGSDSIYRIIELISSDIKDGFNLN